MSKGSWTIMSRTSKMLNILGDQLRGSGTLYQINGRLSFDEDMLKAMHVWDDLQQSGFITPAEAITLYSKLPKRGDNAMVAHGKSKTLESVDPTKPLTYQELKTEHGLLANDSAPAEDVLKLSEEDKRYLKAIRRRSAISTTPAVKLSTIHRMKGGEDENIVLLTDMGFLPHRTLQESPDDEHRVFYTAVTRTKENLHIVDTESKYRYDL
jgi:superfamily I DNA/RNA helicase